MTLSLTPLYTTDKPLPTFVLADSVASADSFSLTAAPLERRAPSLALIGHTDYERWQTVANVAWQESQIHRLPTRSQ
jgi:hypothetical protein